MTSIEVCVDCSLFGSSTWLKKTCNRTGRVLLEYNFEQACLCDRVEAEDGGTDADWDDEVEGGSHNRAGSSDLRPPVQLLSAHSDADRQRDLQEALLLQIDMQKKLHEQLEVMHWTESGIWLLGDP